MNKYLTVSNRNPLFSNNSFFDFHCEIDPPLYNHSYDIEVSLIRLIISDSRLANDLSGKGGGGGGGGFTARTAEEEEEKKEDDQPMQSVGKILPSSTAALPSAQPQSSSQAATIVTAASAVAAPAPPSAPVSSAPAAPASSAPAAPAPPSAPASSAPAAAASVTNKPLVNSLVISNATDPVNFRAGVFKSMGELYNAVKSSLGPRYLENALKRFSIAAISDQQKLAKYLANNPKQPPKFQIISIPEPRNELITSKGDVIPFPIRLYTSAADLFTAIRLASPSMVAGFNALEDLDAIVSKEFPTIQILVKNSPVQQIPAAAVRRPARQAPPPNRYSTLYSLLPAVIPVQCNFIESSQVPAGNAPLLRTVSRGEGTFVQGSWHFNFTSFEYHPVVKNDMKLLRIRFDPSIFDWSLLSYNHRAYISTLMVLHIRTINNQPGGLLPARHSRKRRCNDRTKNARSNSNPTGVYRGVWSTLF